MPEIKWDQVTAYKNLLNQRISTIGKLLEARSSEEIRKRNYMKYILYATDKEGDGYVQIIGEFDNLEDIEIYIGHFADDVKITIEEKRN